MNSLYICEPGIKLWEQPAHTTAPGFTTISILDKSISNILETWQELTKILIIDWTTAVKWRAIGHSLEFKNYSYGKKYLKTKKGTDLFFTTENKSVPFFMAVFGRSLGGGARSSLERTP